MKKLTYLLTYLTAALSLFAMPASANPADCSSTHNGTVPDVALNLYNACVVEATHSGSVGEASVRLIANSLDVAAASGPVTAADVHDAMEKMVIFVGGIGDNGVDSDVRGERMAKYNLDDFLQDGYSVLYVGLDNSAQQSNISVQDTAYALEATLSFVNSHRSSDYSLALLGYSMGGLSARYALANMELNSIDHNVGIYVSYDAPHRGANVPQALQNIVPTMEQYLTDIENAYNTATGFMNAAGITASLAIAGQSAEDFLDGLKAELKGTGATVINSTLAKQMLLQHVAGTTEFDALQAELLTTGYPQNSVNVAVTNGSVAGVNLPAPSLDANGAFYQFFGKKGADVSKAFVGARFALYPTAAGTTNLTANFNWWFTRTYSCWPLPAPCTSEYAGGVPKSKATPAGIVSYDQVPGSKGEFFVSTNAYNPPVPPYSFANVTPGMVLDAVTEESLRPHFDVLANDHAPLNYTFTFIPTYSALDITVADPAASISQIDQDSSPFDTLYINGDKTALAGQDNVSHSRVIWPQALIQQIEGAIAPVSPEEQAVVWLNLSTSGYTAFSQALRVIFEVPGNEFLPTDVGILLSSMLQYEQVAGAFTDINNLKNIPGGAVFISEPDKLDDLVTYVQGLDVLDGYTNTQCEADQNPQAICDKIP